MIVTCSASLCKRFKNTVLGDDAQRGFMRRGGSLLTTLCTVQAAGFVDGSGKMRTIPFEVMVQGDKAPVRIAAALVQHGW